MTPGENQATADSGAGIEIVSMPAELDLTTSQGVVEQGLRPSPAWPGWCCST